MNSDYDDKTISMLVQSRPSQPPSDKGATLPTVRVVSGEDSLRHCIVPKDGRAIVGRDPTCSLPLRDPSVSRQHASFFRSGDGIEVEDLQSTNGTSIHGMRIARSKVQEGELIEVGSVVLKLERLNSFELAHLARVLERLKSADRDPLTGLLTRSAMSQEAISPLAPWSTRQGPSAAIMGDLDHFKSINDRYGHLVGDAVLRDVGYLIVVGVRDGDPCIRYGGEEILCLLHGADEKAAMAVAERLRVEVERHPWSVTTEGLAVTISFGVAIRRPEEPVEAMIRRADNALYCAKRSGRNRVCLDKD